MENKNTSRVVIGVLVVLVLLLGGYIAVSGGKSAATANGASEAAALPMETYQAQYVKPETVIPSAAATGEHKRIRHSDRIKQE